MQKTFDLLSHACLKLTNIKRLIDASETQDRLTYYFLAYFCSAQYKARSRWLGPQA